MVVSLKTDLRFPIPGQWGHGGRIIQVVQIYKDSGEISLLRNTVFSKLQLDKMKEFRDVFNDPALADFVGNGGITTTIEAPVIMIIPIAIYV